MSERARGRQEMRAEHRAWGNPELPAEDKAKLDTEDEETDQVDDEEVVPGTEAVVEEEAAEELGEQDDGEAPEEDEEAVADVATEPYAKAGAVATATVAGGVVAATGGASVPEYRDITDLLNLPQVDAARQLNLPMSTLSKRWKEAVRIRKWPHRQVAKLDKEIMTLLHNIPARGEGEQGSTPPEIEQALGVLLRRRQEELRPVRIRM